MKVLDASTMQKWEQRTVESGTSVLSLMQTAVSGLHHLISTRLTPTYTPRRALVVCGKGNNGNDALWLAHCLRESGWDVTTWLTHPPSRRISVPAPAIRSEIKQFRPLRFPARPDVLFSSSDPLLVIDGILGLGASGTPRGSAAEMLSWLRTHRRPQDTFLSIDSPSGMDATSGELFDPFFPADFTVALGAVKSGCLHPDAAIAVGRLSAVSLPLADPPPVSPSDFFSLDEARAMLPPRSATTYKHQMGSVAIWAGSPGMSGAALLAGEAALRSGAGLIRLFTHEHIAPLLMAAIPEIMVEPVSHSGKLNPSIFKSKAILAGPGIGTNAQTASLLTDLLSGIECPLTLDADALSLCASGAVSLSSLPRETVLTPHAGEFRKLLSLQTFSRSEDAHRFTTLNPHLILCLKGPNTLIASSHHGFSWNGSGNPGMATAGSGDVLAGLLTGLRARGLTGWDASRLAAFWHGLAGDHAASLKSEDGLTAGDIIASLPAARLTISRP